MKMATKRNGQRRGAWTVEAALVLCVFLLFVFAILEYARFLLTVQLLNEAAREGARYAVVNAGSGVTTAQVQSYVDSYLAGQGANQIQGYNATTNITVFQADPSTGLDNGQGWTNAGNGKAIGVKISGTFNTILVGIPIPFLKLQVPLLNNTPIQATCVMYAEAN